MSAPTSPEVFQLGSWNVLHDNLPNGHRIGVMQPERLDGIMDLLVEQGEFGAVGLYEVHGTPEDNPAASLAKRLGLSESAFSFCSLSGVVLLADGEVFQEIREVELDPDHENRKAIIARGSGELTVAVTHPSHYPLRKGRDLRERQIGTLLEHLEDDEHVIIAGDLNAMPWQDSRQRLEDAGFTSAHTATGQPHPPTYPADRSTCDIGVPRVLQPLVRAATRLTAGVSIDGVYVRGALTPTEVRVMNAVVNDDEGKKRVLSDHHGLIANIELSSMNNIAELVPETVDGPDAQAELAS